MRRKLKLLFVYHFSDLSFSKGKKATTPRRGRSASRGRTQQQKSAPARSKSRGRPKSRSNSRNSKKTEQKPEPRQTRSRSISKSQPVPKTVAPVTMAPRTETPKVVPPPRSAVISPAPILPIPSSSVTQSEVIQNTPITKENGLEKKSESIISNLTLYTAVLIIFSLCLWSLTQLAEKGRTDILPGWWFTFKRDNEQNLPDPVSVAISSISVLVAKVSWKFLKNYQ